MSAALQLSLFDLLISSAEASPAKTSRALAKAPVSLVPVADSGSNTTESLPNSARHGSSSKTSRQARASGCPMCGTDCGMSDTIRPPSRFLPSMLERPTSAAECSSLLPTPVASNYGSNQGGANGRVGKVRLSLSTMAKRGLLPTPTVTGNNNRKGASPNSGDGLATVMGGPLSPRFTEWLMGFVGGGTPKPTARERRRPAVRGSHRADDRGSARW